ncbi:hypothetical protein ACFLSQ_10075, partial [Bacteroidota bacterium]
FQTKEITDAKNMLRKVYQICKNYYGGFSEIYIDKSNNNVIIIWNLKGGNACLRGSLDLLYNSNNYFDKDKFNYFSTSYQFSLSRNYEFLGTFSSESKISKRKLDSLIYY